jgi:hypothetical protein
MRERDIKVDTYASRPLCAAKCSIEQISITEEVATSYSSLAGCAITRCGQSAKTIYPAPNYSCEPKIVAEGENRNFMRSKPV